MKIIDKPIPIYQGYLRIILTNNFMKAADKLRIDNEGHNLNLFGAFVCSSRNEEGEPYYNVFFHPDVDHDLIAHEVVHLVNAIYVDRKIRLDPHNDEPQAYLTGWVTKQIYDALKGK